MLTALFSTVYQIYTQPLFELHCMVFWSICIACLLYDMKTFAESTEHQTKYSIEDAPIQNSNRPHPEYINWPLYFYAIPRALFVQVCLLAPLMWIIYPFYSTNLAGGVFRPSSLRLLTCCGLVEEVLFYYTHRLLHLPCMWRFHRLHHEVVNPVAVATFYASTVENLISNILPVLITPLIVGLPVDLLWYWTIVSTSMAVLSHSGFKKLEFFSEFHAIHHIRRGCNYGILTLLDRLHSTYVETIQTGE
jgi:sterol desaturase/sphingolipid hydroxylase (fatty acid hydroxylase superfamily)